MRGKLIAGNWKMNGDVEMALALSRRIAESAGDLACEMLLCPPFPYLAFVAEQLADSNVFLGAQDCHVAASGAHTGEVSAEMLADIGCRYVIVGHSERRAMPGEENAVVMAKASAAYRASLVAIICVGESEVERDSGKALAAVEAQLTGSVPDLADASGTVIAYEPVWAIGTGRTPSLDQIAEMHGHIRNVLADKFTAEFASQTRLLYGGSVNAENSETILSLDGVDGALVGGASLKSDSFLAIGRSCY